MKYCFEIVKTDAGYVGRVPDLDLETKPMPSEDEAAGLVGRGASAYMEVEYRRRRKPIPLPSAPLKDGGRALFIPVKGQLRILLWNALLERHMTQAELASRLGMSRAQAGKFFRDAAGVSVEKYEEALAALGLHAGVVLE